MKKISLYIIVFYTLCSCSVDNDYIFDDISTYRLSQYIDECDSILRSSEYGWMFTLYPDTNYFGGFTFWMDFDENFRVTMESDYATDYLPATSEGSYGYSVSVGPVIGFDAYNHIHLLSDPDPRVAGGQAGEGFYSDFEFLIRGVSADTITIIGKKNQNTYYLVRATADDRQQLQQRHQTMASIRTDYEMPFYNYLTIGSDTAFFYFSPVVRVAYLTYSDGTQTISQRSPVYSSPQGIRLLKPFTLGGQTFSHLSFNESEYQYAILDEGVNFRFFRAESLTEGFKLRLPGAINIAKKYSDGYSIVECGAALRSGSYNLFPEVLSSTLGTSTGVIDGVWFYWTIVGYAGAGLYVNEVESGGGTCAYINLYEEMLVNDGIGDRVRYQSTSVNDTYYSATPTVSTGNAFGGWKQGNLNNYMTNSNFQVIPGGGQMFLVPTSNNGRWALYTPLRRDW